MPISEALPGWIGYRGETQITLALHNNATAGSGSIDIFGPFFSPNSILEGSYSVLLQSGASGGIPLSTAIGQFGLVPSDALSLRFKAGLESDFSLSFAGQSLAPIVLSSGANYILYGADISMLAGQTGELRFTVPFDFAGPNALLLDAITFSPQPVPEPSWLGLFGLAWVAFGLIRRRSSRNS